MSKQPKNIAIEKTGLHPRNRHRLRYDFGALIKSLPSLSAFVRPNEYGTESIDFANPKAVKTLNQALLKHFYGIDYWDIPAGYLCPPIPGRADYIHYLADLLAESNKGIAPSGNHITGLDIGTGANCVYPLIGNKEYGWSFKASEVDPVSLRSAENIISKNDLKDAIGLRHQRSSSDIFRGILKEEEILDFSMCNPPFHSSAQEAAAGSIRKLKNLGKTTGKSPVLNFGGQQNELWYKGGEEAFLRKMFLQSAKIPFQVLWFSSLVSKKDSLPSAYRELKKIQAKDVRTINMSQGQKTSRIVAWTFFTEEERQDWSQKRWNK